MDSQEVAKVKQPPVLFSKTQGLIEKITQKLGAPMVTYWNNPRGFTRKTGLNATHLSPEINGLLLELHQQYAEMGQKASTDFDECHAHSNEILNIWETGGMQIFFQQDKDWFYRSDERRWITMNDHSGWRRVQRVGGKIKKELLHIV